jgi:hypothetical protein
MRLPNRRVPVLEHGDTAVRVHRTEGGLVQPAETAAGGHMLILEPELANEPKHLLHIEGTAASPNSQHDNAPFARLNGRGR